MRLSVLLSTFTRVHRIPVFLLDLLDRYPPFAANTDKNEPCSDVHEPVCPLVTICRTL